MPAGYTGKALFVDLTRAVIQEEEIPEQIYRAFIGGNGLGVRILYERMRPNVDPLGPDNLLGFVPGLLTATPVPGSGRYVVVSKSPLTGAWGESNSGGSFGPELKTAGYDAVFFSGISPRPVYLLIRDGEGTLRDASPLWGKDTYDTEELLRQQLGDNAVKIACIGPAGESKSLLAGIFNDGGRTAARTGLGAVMGSKRLKAVAVKGGLRKAIVANPQTLKEARQRLNHMIKANEFAKGLTAGGTGKDLSFLVSIGDSPLANWSLSGLDKLPTSTNLNSGNTDSIKTGSYGCYACPVKCGAILKQNNGRFAIPGEMHRPEYESLAGLGSVLMNDNMGAAVKATDLCNRYGMDTINTGGTIAMAMECYERGLLTQKDTGGIELTWGNAEAIVELVEQIGKREGFGAILADGAEKAAEHIGKGAERYAITVRGKSLPFHDPRLKPALGTAFISDANPAHHMDCQIVSRLETGGSIGDDPALQIDRPGVAEFDKKGPMYALGYAYHQLIDAAGLCALYNIGTAPPPVAELIAGVTGWDFGWKEALQTGRRILTLRQMFNVREGLTPDKFQLPKRLMEEQLSTGTLVNRKIDFTALRGGYFTAMGWDTKTGKPNKKALTELGLAELAQDIGL